ncbi:MAG: hypothetical protein LKI34_00860 [Bifidobacterium tibiigranuli]|jgi:hypothetical protein|uniref:hypothetical protein n=1 Tax=Bifidobacterium tibiigranuli TaxID=2172043 RepID=UPI0026F26BDF|nr:hypothetical protein [Bifidobacterium tibiigranuli]MCI1672762.1 hypothetical protein [Bifidobacterium tibiigranuli]MCI1712233.1 hypothetical protein [Bifidobacterium tibiigranuli]MCI1833231.1 hypothetical protein [Bifidobacterium tibiigranuli]
MMRRIVKTAGLLSAMVAMTIALGACGGAQSSASIANSIGDMPSYLPSARSASIAHGSADKPALSYPGSPVLVSVGKAQLKIDIAGPEYPSDTKEEASDIPSVFTATLTNTAAPGGADVPLSTSVFDILDNAGATHALIPTPGLPKKLAAGQQLTIKLRTSLPGGEGLLRFHPDGGPSAAGWDYVLEDD